MQTTQPPENVHIDFESKLKKIINIFEQDKTLFFTVSYLILTGIGMIFSGIYFYFFSINILEYSQISDFILIAFKDPFYILFFILTISFIYFLYLFDKWILRRFPKIWEFRRKRLKVIKPTANSYLWSYGAIVLMYTFYVAVIYGRYKVNAIKSGKGLAVKVYLTTGAEPVKTDSLPLLIGTTSSVVFLYHPQTKSTEIVPFNSVRKIAIQNKETKDVSPKTSNPPTRKP